ncbi:MAG: hypothetical protein LVR00_00030 [Rhabdochlamydiaceae bacterium]|jgi:hypothetical protein
MRTEHPIRSDLLSFRPSLLSLGLPKSLVPIFRKHISFSASLFTFRNVFILGALSLCVFVFYKMILRYNENWEKRFIRVRPLAFLISDLNSSNLHPYNASIDVINDIIKRRSWDLAEEIIDSLDRGSTSAEIEAAYCSYLTFGPLQKHIKEQQRDLGNGLKESFKECLLRIISTFQTN